MADAPTRPPGHVPAVVKGHGDTWAVYCPACSDAARDWIYPCGLMFGLGWRDEETPPQLLVPAPAETVEKIIDG